MAEPVTLAAGIGWGMKAAGWIASPILSELFKKASPYLDFDASKKLEELEANILLLELVTEMVEESPHRDRLQNLFEDLKFAFYKAEEILDDVEYHRLKKQIKEDERKPHNDAPPRKRDWVKKKAQSAMPSSLLNKQGSGMSKIMLKKSLDKIEKVINDTCEILKRINLPIIINANRSNSVAASSQGAFTTATPPLVVIGREKDCEKMISTLHEREEVGLPDTNSAQRYSVIGIHGFSGSGKSTLAQLVCEREKKDGHFDLVMWVQVTENFSVDTIFKMIFNAATGTSCPQFDNPDTLEFNLKKELHGKRFLLVLDDVWCSRGDVGQFDKLQKILTPLNAGEAGSKILVTSKTEDALVALGAAEHRRILIPALEEDDFRKLFMHHALPAGVPIKEHVRTTLEGIGKDIAKKLKGSPLAAKLVGFQLHGRTNDVECWKRVRGKDILNETMGALWWCYRHLDEQVKRCFAYCSIFPRKRAFKRDELAKLWAAAGFVRSTYEGEDAEDVCQEYFDELVSASFLQKDPILNDRYIVHDLLHDLAERVAKSDHLRIENYVRLKKDGFAERKVECIIEGSTVEVSPDVRHVFLQIYDAALITEKICECKHLRTLIIDSEGTEPVEEEVLKRMFVKLKKLRVLSIFISGEDAQETLSVPASVCELRHLRYLAFRTGGSIKLVPPSTLSKLCKTSCEDWCDLINLRHVIYNGYLKIRNVGRLRSIRTMERFMVRKEQGYELKQLRNLNKLGGELWICGIENVENKAKALEAKLADKEGLRTLKLRWDGEASAEAQKDVLEGLCPPKHLDNLIIENYKGLKYPSWMVDRHNNDGPDDLTNLRFRCCSQQFGPEFGGFGTNLYSLTIWDCSWVYLPDCREHLTSLHELYISFCMNIRSLPRLPLSLQRFTLSRSNDALMSLCKIIGDPNRENIRHIPHARIGDCVIKMGVVAQVESSDESEASDGAEGESPEPETP